MKPEDSGLWPSVDLVQLAIVATSYRFLFSAKKCFHFGDPVGGKVDDRVQDLDLDYALSHQMEFLLYYWSGIYLDPECGILVVCFLVWHVEGLLWAVLVSVGLLFLV